MIPDISQQNKQLSDAGKTPKDTSPRVEKAVDESKKVTTGKDTTNTAVDTGKRVISNSKDRKMGGKPSFEGYMKSSSAVISMSNTGYLNPGMQTSRNSTTPTNSFLLRKDEIFAKNPSNNLGAYNNSASRITNYSKFTETGSSSDRISGIIKNNNLI
jgi:hypothetical protein